MGKGPILDAVADTVASGYNKIKNALGFNTSTGVSEEGHYKERNQGYDYFDEDYYYPQSAQSWKFLYDYYYDLKYRNFYPNPDRASNPNYVNSMVGGEHFHSRHQRYAGVLEKRLRCIPPPLKTGTVRQRCLDGNMHPDGYEYV